MLLFLWPQSTIMTGTISNHPTDGMISNSSQEPELIILDSVGYKIIDVEFADEQQHRILEVGFSLRATWYKLRKGAQVTVKKINRGFTVEYYFDSLA